MASDQPSCLTSLPMVPSSLDDCQFIDDVPDHLTCSICLGVICDPHLLSCCGIKYCNDCINPIKSVSKPCPNCREPSFITLLDKEIQRAVLNLKVYCDHKAEGCTWEGEIRYLEGHLRDKCLHVGMACKYCGKKYPKQSIDTHEGGECPLLPMEIKIMNELRTISCRVKTLESECEHWKNQSAILSKEVIEHKKKYTKDMERVRTEADEDRLKYQEEVKELRDTVESLRQKTSEVHEKTLRSMEVYDECIPWAKKCQTYSENLSRSFRDWDIPRWQSPPPITFSSSTPPCQFIMSDFTVYCESGNYWYSPPFYSWPGGYKLCLKVLAKGDMGKYVSVGVVAIQGEYDTLLSWPIHCLAKVKILNMLKNVNHVSHEIMVESMVPAPDDRSSPFMKKRPALVHEATIKSSRSWFDIKSMTSTSPSSDKASSYDSTSTFPHQPTNGSSLPSTMIARFISHASMSENPLTASKYCGLRDCVCFRVEHCLDVSKTCKPRK